MYVFTSIYLYTRTLSIFKLFKRRESNSQHFPFMKVGLDTNMTEMNNYY